MPFSFGRTAFGGRFRSSAHRRSVAALALLVAGCALPAQALVIRPTFDSSITSRSNAAAIESAFNATALQFDHAFADPATVNITVSWGSVAGRGLASGDLGGSVDNLSGAYSFASLSGYLTAASKANPRDATLASAVAHLPRTDPLSTSQFEIPYAEAKAVGLLPRTLSMTDGYIGFSNSVHFDFNPVGGISTGYYDFQGIAAHEIEEVLGRTTGLESYRSWWATPFDLYRYRAAGASSFSYSTEGYFSVDGGRTDLGNFNYSGAGDRSDWLSSGAINDLQSAYLTAGKAYALSASDFTALDALGWGGWTIPNSPLSTGPSRLSLIGAAGAVPEPAAWLELIAGFALIGARLRRRRVPAKA